MNYNFILCLILTFETVLLKVKGILNTIYYQRIFFVYSFMSNVKLVNSKYPKYISLCVSYNTFNISPQETEHWLVWDGCRFAQNYKIKNINLKILVMFLNNLGRSRLPYGCHMHGAKHFQKYLKCQIYSKISKIKGEKGFVWMKPACLGEYHCGLAQTKNCTK